MRSLDRKNEHGDIEGIAACCKVSEKAEGQEIKGLYKKAINAILEDPTIGEEKTGDLKGVWGYDIYSNRINYELAYTIQYVQVECKDEPDVVVIIMAGTRENFYEQMKRYWK